MLPSLRAVTPYSSAQQFSFDDQAVRTRIIHILAQKLTKAHPNNIAELVIHISTALARMKQNNELGSRGILNLDNIFLGIGYEGATCYMGLMVNAPDAGAVRCFFRGDARETKDLHELHQQVRMNVLELSFVSALLRQYDQIKDAKLARWL